MKKNVLCFIKPISSLKYIRVQFKDFPYFWLVGIVSPEAVLYKLYSVCFFDIQLEIFLWESRNVNQTCRLL